MNSLPITQALLTVAARVVWFKEPLDALADPVHFLAHVMTYGTPNDLLALRGIIGVNEYREVLAHAPAGVFDARSWAYWNLVCGRSPRRCRDEAACSKREAVVSIEKRR